MAVNILAVGDVVGENGVAFLSSHLRAYKKLKGISFTVVNGENASMVGLTPRDAERIFEAGADVITLGNHAFGKSNILPYLEDNKYILRPSNASPLSPGRGWGVFDSPFGDICIINLLGRCGMDFGTESPFFEADRILRSLKDQAVKTVLVDIHAEATSEKAALAYYLLGRVSVVWGTHTHVQTSDACVLEQGCGFITDLGMTGPARSILGIRPEQSVSRFLGEQPRRQYTQADGACKMEGCIFELDPETGRCLSAEAIRIY